MQLPFPSILPAQHHHKQRKLRFKTEAVVSVTLWATIVVQSQGYKRCTNSTQCKERPVILKADAYQRAADQI
jgi:hypothetical protein